MDVFSGVQLNVAIGTNCSSSPEVPSLEFVRSMDFTLLQYHYYHHVNTVELISQGGCEDSVLPATKAHSTAHSRFVSYFMQRVEMCNSWACLDARLSAWSSLLSVFSGSSHGQTPCQRLEHAKNKPRRLIRALKSSSTTSRQSPIHSGLQRHAPRGLVRTLVVHIYFDNHCSKSPSSLFKLVVSRFPLELRTGQRLRTNSFPEST